MTMRITCPSCDTSLKFDDEKAGKKVRCRECDKLITLPAPKSAKRKRSEETAVQTSRTTKAKAARSRSRDRDDDDDDDDDDRPSKKKKKKGGAPLGLILGGVGAAAVVLLVLVGGGIGAYVMMRKPTPALAAANPDPPIQDHRPEPEKNKAPEPIQNPQPVNPPVANNANQLTPDAVKRVEQATVYLAVRMGDGKNAEGSGFFCIDPGLVITNAHVVGMLGPKAPRPQKIDVVLNSGLPNEFTTPGTLIGVDRSSDLAVLRVNVPNPPQPLTFDDSSTLFRTQKVFISGFPLGRSLGKDITITDSSINSLRNDPATGVLDQIQTNGGMQPGNSGGPVVSANGKLVGVAVAGIKGTTINFAIPADHLKRLMDGRTADVTTGEAYTQSGQTKLPVKVATIDPLNKIRQIRVDVWTGMPGQPRPASYQQPQQMPGDGQRLPQPLNYQVGMGSADISVPAAPPGQVYWLQPVITNSEGKTHWGMAVPTSATATSPLDRKPADLTVNLTAQKERIVNLKSAQSIIIGTGKVKDIIALKVETDMLEVMNPDPKGSRIKTAMGKTDSYIEDNGQKRPSAQQSVDIVRQAAPQFVIDNTNKLHDQITRKLNPTLQPDIKKEVERTTGHICSAYLAVNLPMPNRVVQPTEKWNTTVPLIVGTPPRTQVIDLILTCTYEGIRTRNQRSEGLITVTGIVKDRVPKGKGKIKGPAQPQGPVDEVNGKIAFDLAGGFISFAQLKITSETDVDTFTFDIDLTRAPGNGGLALAPEPPPGPNPNPQPMPGMGKVVLQQGAFLAFTDPFDPTQQVPGKNKKAHYKEVAVQMQQGKTYTITVTSPGFPARVRVLAANGVLVAQGQAPGNNTTVTYQATAAGFYRINVCTTNGNVGQFQVTVTESP